MSEHAEKICPSLYEALESLPEPLVGEILGGQLHTQPRPSGRHGNAASVLGGDIEPAYHRGRGGPGGWWILMEPEIHFIRDTEVGVPDLAGWRQERMPNIPDSHRFEVVPDWVCEILSPSTESKDRKVKMPIYARYGVAYAWLVDPEVQTLEAFALDDGAWTCIGRFQNDDPVCVAPFDAITIRLSDLWS